MDYIDIHCHLGFPDYDKDREEVISEMQKNKIAAITVGVDFETSKKELEIAKAHENIFACVGQHPENLGEFDERIAELAQDNKVVSIGECGLDYFGRRSLGEGGLSEDEKNKQKEIFERQIDLALEVDKPLMLHIRPSDKIDFDAYFDSLDILERRFKESGDKLKGNAHFFVGNMKVLKRFLEIGFTFSFGGVVTFANEYDEVIKYLPLERIMSETDAPLVAPAPYRGQRNSPVFISEIVNAIARIRNEDIELVKSTLLMNARKSFSILLGV